MDVRCIALVAGCIAFGSSSLCAAPFVAGEPRSLSQQIAAARAAVVAHPVDAATPQSGWVVDSILNDPAGGGVTGKVIHPRPAPPRDAKRVLLISNADRSVSVLPLSDAAAAYVASLPAVDSPVEDRVRFAVRHLGSGDQVIAEDVFAEIARLTRAELGQFRKRLPAERLRKLIEAEETPPERLGLYGFLLGLCGTKADAAALRRRLLACDGFCGGADGLAAGYLLLTGEPGLADLEANVLLTERTSPMRVAAFFEALAFFRSEMTERFDQDRLRKSACCALARTDVADLAIGHLAAARDWQALPQVAALLEADDPDPTRRRAMQVTAVRFLLECRRDVDADSKTRSVANRLLDRVAAGDPDLFRRASRISGEPTPRY